MVDEGGVWGGSVESRARPMAFPGAKALGSAQLIAVC